ncbi:MAG: hypothetical protein IKZ22_10300, partial [Kiritimatiellae bacterium]|nr:hypothetical protein [Kiritimatiellia bacterium]
MSLSAHRRRDSRRGGEFHPDHKPHLFQVKTGKIFRSIFTVGAFTALSRVLGLVREMLQSRIIGAGVEQSAFTLAFALPNMARKLFGEGALTAAFVPVFKAEAENASMERAE